MPSKPRVPAIPEKLAGRSPTSARSRATPQAHSKEPPLQPDLWDAFAGAWEGGEPVEAAPTPESKTGRRPRRP